MNMKTRAGFTLIELLVVMAIIGILSAVLLTNFVGIRERGADVGLKNDATQLRTALRLYYNDFQRYPDSNGSGAMEGCVDGTQVCALGGEFANGDSVYMKTLPEDFSYYSDGLNEFLVRVTLANVSDADIEQSQTRCDVAGRSYFTDTLTETDYFVCED